MENHENSPAVLLTEDHADFGGMSINYQLLLRNDYGERRFRIRVKNGGELCEGDMGRELDRALKDYRKIVTGSVTPCALDDVLSELHYFA